MELTPWWKEAVIYQIYPRSFFDSNGDGEGDLPGITSRLDYIHKLGVDAIWLSPFYTSPNKDGGYDVANPRDVDPRFGTLSDAKNLIVRAHDLNLRVDLQSARAFISTTLSQMARHLITGSHSLAAPPGLKLKMVSSICIYLTPLNQI